MQTQTNAVVGKRTPIPYRRTLTKKQIAKIPLTEAEHQKLIQPPLLCLKRFEAGTQDANDWYVITFRLRIGNYVAAHKYEAEVAAGFERALSITLEMLARYNHLKDYNWSVSSDEIKILKDALDLVEAIQRDVDRETMIFYTRKVYNEMIKFTS